jgi:hypothetical protein
MYLEFPEVLPNQSASQEERRNCSKYATDFMPQNFPRTFRTRTIGTWVSLTRRFEILANNRVFQEVLQQSRSPAFVAAYVRGDDHPGFTAPLPKQAGFCLQET